MFNLSLEVPLTEAIINYDLTDMLVMIKENENEISEYLNNSSLMESDAASIKDRFLKMVNTIITYVRSKMKQIFEAVKSFTNNMHADMDTIVKEVEQRLYAGEYDNGPKMSVHNFELDRFDISQIDISKILKNNEYDFTININSINQSTLVSMNRSVEAFKIANTKDIKLKMINAAQQGKTFFDIDKYMAEKWSLEKIVYTWITHGYTDNRKFDKIYIAELYDIDTYKKRSEDSLNNLLRMLDNMTKEIETAYKNSGNDHNVITKYLEAKLQFINLISSFTTMINMQVIKASILSTNEHKKFIMKAYHYKKPVTN